MLNDSTQIFYDVDYETSLPGNKTAWLDLAQETLKDPAIVFPPEQGDYAKMGHLQSASWSLSSSVKEEELWRRSWGGSMSSHLTKD